MSELISVSWKKSAFKSRVSTYALENLEHDNLTEFFKDAKHIFIRETKNVLKKFPIIKLNACLEAIFKKVEYDKEEEEIDQESEYTTYYVQTVNKIVDCSTKISKFYTRNIQKTIMSQLSEADLQGSGWSLHEIKALIINNNKHQMFSGATHIDLPKFINNKKAVINVKNSDNECFRWAVLSALHPKDKNPQRVSNYYPFKNELNLTNMTFPVTVSQLNIFERQNENISINVYAIDEEYDADTRKKEQIIVPIRISETYKKHHIHLLWICDEESIKNRSEINEETRSLVEIVNDTDVASHYCYIKNLAKLIVSQCNSDEHKIWVCDRCLHYFYSEIKLEKHTIDCESKNKCRISLPKKNSMQRWISFKNFNRQLPIPFIVYADIESLLQPTSNENILPPGAYQKHTAICIGYYFHCLHDPKRSVYKTYSGSDCIAWFVNELYNISIEVASLIRQVPKMILNVNEKKLFDEATTCHICHKVFDDFGGKVRDHSHLTGIFRGAAHNECNLKYQEARILPVVFHNLNYDSHFLITTLSSAFEGKIDIIPINSEHYISFTKEVEDSTIGEKGYEKIKIRFIDSYRFLPSSLEKLASFLPKDKLIITSNEWGDMTMDKFKLLSQKGIYPYDYMDSMSKLNETELPPKEAFYNQLNDQKITDEEYTHAQRVWDTFEIKNLLEYTNIYLKTDVLLLADIFENFRKTSLNLYGLDPAHYFTTPGLSWDAMLKYTNVRLEVLTDIDMLMFVEQGEKKVIKYFIHQIFLFISI